MNAAVVELVLYALIATLTPLGFAATLAVIESGRLNALVFCVTFVLAQLLTCAVLVVLGVAAIPDRRRGYPGARAVLEVAFGLALLVLARIVHRGRAKRTYDESSRVVERLRRLRPWTAVAAGLLLGVGGPKRLVLTALAAASIATGEPDHVRQAALVVLYTAIATLVVWVPIMVFQLVGERVVEPLLRAQRWFSRRWRPATAWTLAAIGVAAAVQGVIELF